MYGSLRSYCNQDRTWHHCRVFDLWTARHLFGYLPGQEATNVSHVTRCGVGGFSRDSVTIADIVVELVGKPVSLALQSRRTKALCRLKAIYNIISEIGKLVGLKTFLDVHDTILEG